MNDDPRPTRLCLHCGYDLRVTTAPRCPECGSHFDSPAPSKVGEEIGRNFAIIIAVLINSIVVEDGNKDELAIFIGVQYVFAMGFSVLWAIMREAHWIETRSGIISALMLIPALKPIAAGLDAPWNWVAWLQFTIVLAYVAFMAARHTSRSNFGHLLYFGAVICGGMATLVFVSTLPGIIGNFGYSNDIIIMNESVPATPETLIQVARFSLFVLVASILMFLWGTRLRKPPIVRDADAPSIDSGTNTDENSAEIPPDR